MNILTKKIFREFRFNKFRSLVIVITVAITITLGIGLLNIKDSYNATIAAHHENLVNADLRIRLNEYIPENNLSTWLSDQEVQSAGVENLEGRIFLYTTVNYKGEDYKAYTIGVNFALNEINTLEVISGGLPSSSSEVLLEKHFRAAFLSGPTPIKVDESITVKYGPLSDNFTISGIAIDSDYFYPVDEQTNSAAFNGELCIIYVHLQHLQAFLGVEGINEVLVKTDIRSHDASQVADRALADVIGSDIIQKVTYWDETPDFEFFNFDNPHDKFGLVFGAFGLIAGATAIYNSLSKLVQAQRTHVGLYGALGAKKWSVFSHYLGFGVILGLIGIGIGWLGAAGLSSFAVTIRGSWHGFTVIRIGQDPVIWIGGSLFSIVFIGVVSFFATIPVLRLTPREAMVAPYSKSQLGQEPILEKLLPPFGIFRRLSIKIPLRTVFMNKRRSLSTLIAVATSMIILVAAGSMFFDIVRSMDQNFTYYEKHEVNVYLQKPMSEWSIKSYTQDIEGIAEVEGYIGTQVFISDFDNESVRVPLHAFHENSTLRNYHVIKGIKNFEMSDLGKNKILIGSELAKEHGIKVGETLKVTFDPLNSFSLEIIGITGELFDTALLWTIEGLQENSPYVQGIATLQNVTGFVFSFDDDVTETRKAEIKSQIVNHFYPFIYSETDELLTTMESMFEALMGLLIFVGLLGLSALILFTFSSMSLAMMDREMEFLALRAMGSKHRTILKVIFLENALYGAFGLIIGIPLSLALLEPSYDYLIEGMYMPVYVPLELWIIVISSIIVCVFLSTALLAWRTWRSSLPDMLHHRGIS
ncbi:MAG: FtsX-like permease family protein [Candidatus Hermodarchaeota archaeon]